MEARIYDTRKMKELLGGVSDSTLRRMLAAGEIPKPWKRRMWLAAVVDAFFDEQASQQFKRHQIPPTYSRGSDGDGLERDRL